MICKFIFICNFYFGYNRQKQVIRQRPTFKRKCLKQWKIELYENHNKIKQVATCLTILKFKGV